VPGALAGWELYGRCECGDTRRFAVAPLARKYGGNTHYTYLEQLMVRQTCGTKGSIHLTKLRWDEVDPKDRIPY
jgi:hypothetical protein